MEISLTIIFIVVLFMCLASAFMGAVAVFLVMARDKSLVRVGPGQMLVERDQLEELRAAAAQGHRRSATRYDGKIPAGEFDEDE